MEPKTDLWPRRRFLATVGAASVGGVGLSVFGAERSAGAAGAATTVSYVDTTQSTYDKLVLMVDGKPFYHSGIQFRYEKHRYSYGWTDAQLRPVLGMVAQDGFNVVNIPIWWSKIETSRDNFSWADVDRMIDWCKEYGLKLEFLWFGHDSTGFSFPARLPSYVLNGYQYVVRPDGTELRKKGTGEPGEPPEGFGLLDKTDPNLLSREKYALGRLMNHVAAYDTGHTVVGVQLLNEPNVSGLWDVRIDRSYSSYANALWRSGGYTNATEFRKDVLLNYLSGLGQAVKESDYVVYTRSNPKGDADIADNEARRARGMAYLDFFGYDPYTTSVDYVFDYGQDAFWAQGRNFPMIMENYAGNSTADILKFNAVAGNAAYNLYAAVDPDAHSGSSDKALYDFNPTTKVVTRKAVSPKVTAMNHLINKISTDLATKRPVERGGTKLQTFNRTATASSNTTKTLDGQSVSYATSSGGQGIAVKHSPTEIAVLSSKAATFTLPGGSIGSVESGYYDSDNTWVRTASKSYSPSGGRIAINLNAGDCVRVAYSGGSSGPVSGATYKIRNSSTGRYLDTDADGAVVLAPASTYDDQDWILTQTTSGAWTVRNVRTGRFYLSAGATSNAVFWNSGAVAADSLWNLEPVSSGGFRLNNQSTGIEYLHATSSGAVRWNTGATDAGTVWTFEPK
ncbi:DUF4978 domain-containing protein [Streptomyces sp. A012304]|uniref:DUF4978 domain-containing protein n=1 Tax=Streptomyces sp. A012304 TaxID=375446 RepID=UPI00222F9B3A|nr:DUF4978 domain-containing protein [Streptomyces sp. A012304]GKQ36241.1 hypothetical protein ALMP_27840 [Streptomyces sp. A012304]